MKRLARRLRSDGGSADPLMVIVTMAASLLVSAAIVGALTTVISLSASFVEEQQMTTLASQAQKAFTQDAQNATAVWQRDAHQVTFGEQAATPSGMSVPRGSKFGCRVSRWAVEEGVLTNVVWRVASASCATAGAAGQEMIRLPSFAKATAITSVNAAGRTLRFADGSEVGSLAGKTAYSTATEWGSTTPKTVMVQGGFTLPLAGTRVKRFTGTTWLPLDRQIGPAGTPEDPPGVNPYSPAAPVITAVRGTTGKAFAGKKESLKVSFAASTCGPYALTYTVEWVPSTAGAQALTRTFPSASGKAFSAELSPVPNGTKGHVTVVAACPAGITGKPGSTTAAFAQSLPAPAVTVAAVAGAPHQHKLTWKPVTSLAASYQAGLSAGTPAAVKTAAGRTSAVSQTIKYTSGSTYGTTKKYTVTASIAGLSGAASSTVKLVIGSPKAPGAVTVTAIDQRGYSYRAASGCPSGTTLQYRGRSVWGATGGIWSAGWSSWNTGTRINVSTSQGARITVQAQARCHAPYADSAIISSTPTSWLRPAPAPKPAPSSVSTASMSGKWFKACTAGMTWYAAWGKASNATSYTVDYAYTYAAGGSSGWIRWGTTAATSASGDVTASVAGSSNTRFRVQSAGPGGRSSWAFYSLPRVPGCY